MKFRNLFFGLAGLAAVSLAACSNEDEVTGPDKPAGVEAYMTLQLVGPQGRTATRTVPGGDQTETGTDVENKIGDVQILLCGDNGVIQHVYNISDGLIATNDGAQTKPIKVEIGDYQVYVIANPGSAALATGANPGEKTIEDVTEQMMKDAYAADNTFIMFSECNGSDKTAGAAISIKEGNDYDHPATCDKINLDRLAVQIRTKGAETVDISPITEENSFLSAAELAGFRLLNGATKVNLQQKWSNTFAGAGSTYPWFNLLTTPELAAGTNAGNSGYYNHLTDFREIEKTENPDGTEDYQTVKDLYENVDAYNGNGKIYCMENNPTYRNGATVDALMGNTTGLVYQFQATVESSDKLAGENCFYGYNGKYYASLDALAAVHTSAFKANGEKDAAAQLAKAKEELTAAADEDGISGFRTKYNVKVYKNGIMYYTYFIKDKNYKNGEEGESYYSIMRNTIYDLTVKSLKRIGTDIPGGWNPDVDPEDPVDSKNVYMVVEMSVNPWVLSKEEIDLQ